MPKEELIPGVERLEPKLQMIANGRSSVNRIRAAAAAAVAVRRPETAEELQKLEAIPPRRRLASAFKKEQPQLECPEQKELAEDIEVSVFIHTRKEATDLAEDRWRQGNLALRRVSLAGLRDITRRPDVVHVELGDPLVRPRPKLDTGRCDPPQPSERQFGTPEEHGDGANVLIGLIDVGGFDFSHPDFLNPDGTTRFLSIWDQGGENRQPPEPQGRFNYGSEITKSHMDAALAAVRQMRAAGGMTVPAWELEPQSQMEPGSHGTHVASIAAGGNGLCRKADIAAVLISIPSEEDQRRLSFYDSGRLADAVDYLLALGDAKSRPVAINISLGTNGHAHDGSSSICRWIDARLTQPGRVVCVAAGNAGQEGPETEGDIGWIMGRIHTSGRIPATGLTADIDWIVMGDTAKEDLSENELELWLSPQDHVGISLRPPGSSLWIGPVKPGEFIENLQLPQQSMISIYNLLYHPLNGANYISLYLSPFYSAEQRVVAGVPAGQWTVRLHGLDIRDGEYHGWIERDDPDLLGRIGDKEYWRFPSFFSTRSNVDSHTVSSLGCGHSIVCVANLDAKREVIDISSSQGPTRDSRRKPDIAAAGTGIVAANGFADATDAWVAMSGTSMAAPLVTGVAGLMLCAEPNLTATQVLGILHRTAKPLPGADFRWNNAAGFGAVAPAECFKEAKKATKRISLK